MKETTWSRMGSAVDGTTMEEVLEQSGLDYNVEKAPIFLADGTEVVNNYATKQIGSSNVFGIVGNSYEIIQNQMAFDFVDNMVMDGLHYERAGQTYTGLVYIIASLPEYKLFGDKMKTYLIFQNSHNGLYQARAAFYPLRIVCQNQFSMAFRKAENMVKIRHTKTASEKIIVAREVMQNALGYTEHFKELASELIHIELSPRAEQRALEMLYPVTEQTTEIRERRAVEARQNIHKIYTDMRDLQNMRGTAWGLFNAYSDHITHVEPARKSENWEQTKFMKSLDISMDNVVEVIRSAA